MGRRLSEATRAKISAKAKERGSRESAKVAEKVRKAMRDIDEKRAQNGGVYPDNGGRVSWAEVARRAGVHETTLFTDQQVLLRKEFDDWFARDESDAGAAPPPRSTRRPLSVRIAELEVEKKELSERFHLVELELQDRETKVLSLQAELASHIAANERLVAELTDYKRGKLVSIRAGRRKTSSSAAES